MNALKTPCVIGRLVLLILSVLPLSCGGEPSPTPDMASTERVVVGQTFATQTAQAPTPASTPTTEPTSTFGPTATATLERTPTPEPTSTPEPTPTIPPTPTPEPQVYIVSASQITTYSNPDVDTQRGVIINGKTFVVLEQVQEQGRTWLHIQLIRADGSPGAEPWILADETAYRPYTEPPRPPEGHFLCPQAPASTPREPVTTDIQYQRVTEDYAIGDSRLIDGWVDEGGYVWVKFWFRFEGNQEYTLTMRSVNPGGLQVEVYREGIGGFTNIPLNDACIGDSAYFYAYTADDLDPGSGKKVRVFTRWGIIRKYQ